MMTSSTMINVKRCIHYQETVVPRLLAIGQGVQIWGQKKRGKGASVRPPFPEASRIKYRSKFFRSIFYQSLLIYNSLVFVTFLETDAYMPMKGKM